MVKYFCDKCGKELPVYNYGIARTDVELRKFTRRKNGDVSCNYSQGVKKGNIEVMLCHKCGDEIEKAIEPLLK